jgi:LPXTG-site transpeptidase (sortase) family protein
MDVVPVGVDGRGDMELPASVAQVGWYEFGSRPADSAGATVLAAHVDSKKEGLGPFARLRNVRKGTTVALTTEDGTVHRYRVTEVELLPKSTVPLAQVFQRDGTPRLTLVTCGGAYDQGTGYSANVVVTAEPLSTVKS